MSEEILINHSALESRVAVLNLGTVSEILIERHQKLGIVGNIYLGTVVRVLPGMQAAFVDIGESRTAFLHLNDMQKISKDKEHDKFNNNSGKQKQLIQYRLRQGERILVQVIKDPLGGKGAQLTTNISLSSRYLVYLPDDELYIGISQKITDSKEKERLKNTVKAIAQAVDLSGSVIVRTAAEFVCEQYLKRDVYYLLQLWRTILARQNSTQKKKTPILLYQELPLPLRCLRDFVNEHTQKILVDDEQMFASMSAFAKEFVPHITSNIVYYSGDKPLFDLYHVENALQAALQRRVNLKSGGYLMIDQTEAMTTIDVNTGSFVSGRSLEEIIYKTNLEATYAIAHQLRLRNLGGIIILDFIDMIASDQRKHVLDNLKKQLALDDAKTTITQVSELGLVEMTRKRIRESLSQQLCESCPTCQGRGYVKSSETLCLEICREIVRCAKIYKTSTKLTVVAHAGIIGHLLYVESSMVSDLACLLEKEIGFEPEPLYTQEQYKIIFN